MWKRVIYLLIFGNSHNTIFLREHFQFLPYKKHFFTNYRKSFTYTVCYHTIVIWKKKSIKRLTSIHFFSFIHAEEVYLQETIMASLEQCNSDERNLLMSLLISCEKDKDQSKKFKKFSDKVTFESTKYYFVFSNLSLLFRFLNSLKLSYLLLKYVPTFSY